MILVPVVVMATAVPTWVERDDVAGDLARDAARTWVLSDGRESVFERIEEMESVAELDLARRWGCPADSGCLQVLLDDRTGEVPSVTVTVRVWMPGVVIPFMGTASGFWAQRTHSEVRDPFRNSTDSGAGS